MNNLFIKKLTRRAGFTLTEMLTVVLIVGVMMSLGLPQYRRVIQRSRATEAISVLRTLADSAERLATSFGYRNVSGFATATAGSPSKPFSFNRFDMVGTSTLPCPVTDSTITCENFTYTLNNDGTISALQNGLDVTLTVHPDLDSSADGYITCSEGEGTSYCALYGYED